MVMRKLMRIYFISPDRGALGYWRCTLPAHHLHKQGHALVAVDFGGFQKELVDWADVVVIQRFIGNSMLHLVEYCRIRGKKVVYELDDNVWHFPKSPEYKTAGREKICEQTEAIINVCDAATVSTDAIGEEIRKRTKTPVYVLPNCLDFEKWRVTVEDDEKDDMYVIGWMGGHYHVLDLEIMVPGLIDVLKENKKIVLGFIGCCPMELLLRYPSRVFLEQFVHIDMLPKVMAALGFKFGLAPLYPNEFGKARSAVRLLQYSALGVPSIVSDWGEYGKMIGEGFPCIVVENGDWCKAVRTALDFQYRKEMGLAAQNFVGSKFDIAKNIWRWKDVYEGLVGS